MTARGPLLLALLAAPAAAAPVPRDDPQGVRIAALFGRPVGPARDGRFRLDGDRLTIRVLDGAGDAADAGRFDGGPRTARPVTGDFTATVTVSLRPPPGPDPAADDIVVYRAGLIVRAGDDQRASCAVERMFLGPAHGWSPDVGGGHWRAGSAAFRAITDRRMDLTRPTVLRLTRRGNAVAFAFDHDGTGWTTCGDAVTVDWPGTVHFGVRADRSGGRGFEAVFEGFAVGPPAK